ncbi:MAG: SEL1-like repeat protein [Synergistaceae bacterium]|nr:SEL1-like repeat protein [Synergistaceae bacterium]
MRKVVAIFAAVVVVCGSIAAFADSFNDTLRKAQRGDADAQTELGIMYAESGNYTEAAKWFTKAANQGHALAQTMLGFAYEHGRGVEQNYYTAAILYNSAAQQGLEAAQVLLDDLIDRMADSSREDDGLYDTPTYGGGGSSGSSKKTCYKCLGDKVERCQRCQGRGGSMQGGGYSHGHKEKEFWVKCLTCYGSGTVPCSVCKGTGVY